MLFNQQPQPEIRNNGTRNTGRKVKYQGTTKEGTLTEQRNIPEQWNTGGITKRLNHIK